MHLRGVEIADLRAIQEFSFQLEDTDSLPGWHVILGDNASGKSTILRAIALALSGPEVVRHHPIDTATWVTRGLERGGVAVTIQADPGVDMARSPTTLPEDRLIFGALEFQRPGPGRDPILKAVPEANASESLWSSEGGWFHAGFGPFRRFQGATSRPTFRRLRDSAHASLFGDEIDLSESLAWLRDCYLKDLEQSRRRQKLSPEWDILGSLKKLLDLSKPFPDETQFEKVTSEGVFFRDGRGKSLRVEHLSDGFRSLIAMFFELIRRLVDAYGPKVLFQYVREGRPKILVPGVVLIDEVDAHLHPSWQRKIGPWFVRVFPEIQFLVTTHSPLVCQGLAADEEGSRELPDPETLRGSIWKLAAPGQSPTQSARVQGQDLMRLVYGDLLDAFETSIFFGKGSRSARGAGYMKQLAELNLKDLAEGLSANEEHERQKLRAAVGSNVLPPSKDSEPLARGTQKKKRSARPPGRRTP